MSVWDTIHITQDMGTYIGVGHDWLGQWSVTSTRTTVTTRTVHAQQQQRELGNKLELKGAGHRVRSHGNISGQGKGLRFLSRVSFINLSILVFAINIVLDHHRRVYTQGLNKGRSQDGVKVYHWLSRLEHTLILRTFCLILHYTLFSQISLLE